MDLSKIYPPRPDWVHKGNYGSLLVVAGSKLYSGSATLAGVSAYRAGCDLVTVCAPMRAADVASHALVDLMTLPLKGDRITTRHVADILDVAHLRRINAVVLGCGLGRHVDTFAAIHKLIRRLSVPMVLDADALSAIATRPDVVFGKHVVLTPHAGELAILLNQKLGATEGKQEQMSDFDWRVEAAKQAARKYRAVVLLKGHVDIICDGETMITNNTGSPLMTKGGFGDTLSGIVGALLARGVGIFEAAYAAAYINGKAGEMAAGEKVEGVVASDIFEFIPKVIANK